MQFLVQVKLLDRDDVAHSVTLGMSGRDTRGKGGAEGTVVSTMNPLDGGGTRVKMNTDLRFSGQVAQLGRPDVVQDVSNRLVTSSRRASRLGSRQRPRGWASVGAASGFPDGAV